MLPPYDVLIDFPSQTYPSAVNTGSTPQFKALQGVAMTNGHPRAWAHLHALCCAPHPHISCVVQRNCVSGPARHLIGSKWAEGPEQCSGRL